MFVSTEEVSCLNSPSEIYNVRKGQLDRAFNYVHDHKSNDGSEEKEEFHIISDLLRIIYLYEIDRGSRFRKNTIKTSKREEKTERNLEVIKMFNNGHNLKQVGEAFGISYQRVAGIIKQHEKKIKKENRK